MEIRRREGEKPVAGGSSRLNGLSGKIRQA
jgi:hypothetical protein